MNNTPPIILDPSNPCSPFAISASKTAVLLLDFHKFIIASQPNHGQSVLAAAKSLREWARSQKIVVVHGLIDLKAITSPNRKMASRANGVREKMCDAPPELTGEPEEIAALSDEYVFWRPPSHVSAMGSYGLDSFLKLHGIESLILAGFSTSGCVINTAKGAADSGFVVTAIKDACGDKMADAHDFIMDKLLVGQCHVAESLGIFTEAWGKKTEMDFEVVESVSKLVVCSD